MSHKTLIIVQSIPEWNTAFFAHVSKYMPTIADTVSMTDSFDHAIDLAPKKGKLTVVTSNMFHDKFSKHYGEVKEKMDENKKDGNTLAKLIKEINPEAKVYVFSEFEPENKKHITGFIKKDRGPILDNVKRAVDALL
ncbi:MAG: hypothetical protein NTW62_01625 [Candidatus Nomurabacteria bacterium]|nr:hypothetical protein [Candidatus Nomurabacteria bacterium]